jgi:hypothetical protein
LLLQDFKEVEDDDEDSNIEVMLPLVTVAARTRGVTVTSTPRAATPCPLITPATSRCPSLDPSCQSNKMPPVILHNLQRNIEPEGAIRQFPTHQSYKAKYEENVLRIHNVEAKCNNLLNCHQTYFLKASNPINLTVRAINLPFADGQDFDGSDAVNDSEKKQEKKVRVFVTTLVEEGFLEAKSHRRSSSKPRCIFERRFTHLGRSPV